jgi:hypothetical protein
MDEDTFWDRVTLAGMLKEPLVLGTTTAFIGYLLPKHVPHRPNPVTVTAIYLHAGGNPSEVGQTLLDAYPTKEHALALVRHGWAALLAGTVRMDPMDPNAHSFDLADREEGTAVFYRRDKAKDGTVAEDFANRASYKDVATFLLRAEYYHVDWTYLYHPEKGWLASKVDNQWYPVATMIKREEKLNKAAREAEEAKALAKAMQHEPNNTDDEEESE